MKKMIGAKGDDIQMRVLSTKEREDEELHS